MRSLDPAKKSRVITARLLAVVGIVCLGLGALQQAPAATRFVAPDARTADGGLYYGPLLNGKLHGHGRLEWDNGASYAGSFEQGVYAGTGALRLASGDVYKGEFRKGLMSGRGRFEKPDGQVYEGVFADGEFTGAGVHTTKAGERHEGRFVNWRPHGRGRYIDKWANTYEGEFVDGELTGSGRFTAKAGAVYEGEFRDWRPHGQGTLRLANGDVYKGGFTNGTYDGEGTLTYAKPQPDGRTRDSGIWRYGYLRNEEQERQAQINVETALYGQRALLDKALASLQPRDPSKINLYLLAIAGDGSQEVFRREVQFVQEQFDRQFRTEGRSVALINSRNTVATAPMATVSSIRETLKAIASHMDRDRDILFLFLTSHGSEEHEVTLAQNNMRLRGLRAKDFAALLAEAPVRWKVVVISACYSGGFIDTLKNENTMIMTAARHDRRSFGCSDDSEFTYFGRAFFKESLPASESFQDAFRRAEILIRKWEAADRKADAGKAEDMYSLPQIAAPAAVTEYVQRWWTQVAQDASRPKAAEGPRRAP